MCDMIALEGLPPPQSCHAVGQPPDPGTLSSGGGSGYATPASAPWVFPPVLGPPPTIPWYRRLQWLRCGVRQRARLRRLRRVEDLDAAGIARRPAGRAAVVEVDRVALMSDCASAENDLLSCARCDSDRGALMVSGQRRNSKRASRCEGTGVQHPACGYPIPNLFSRWTWARAIADCRLSL